MMLMTMMMTDQLIDNPRFHVEFDEESALGNESNQPDLVIAQR